MRTPRTLCEWQLDAHNLAISKGFYDDCPDPLTSRDILSRLMLIVGEVSEAAEEIRKGPQTYGYLVDWDGTKPEGFDIELADVFLRLADLAEACGIDLYRAVSAKHEYNKTRPRLHGKKL